MAAQQAVFDTYELLENIILRLPGHQITRPQLVSKTWKEFINSSSAIRRHYNNGSLLPARWSGSDANIPVYDESPNIKFHPILRRFAHVRKTPPHDVKKCITMDKRNLNSQPVIEAKDDFLTKPPCQHLHIFKLDATEGGKARHVKGGFKIGDLFKLGKVEDDKLIRDAERDNMDPTYSLHCGYILSLHFKEDTAKAAWWKQLNPAEKISKGEVAQT
jgi:hypothetical protein